MFTQLIRFHFQDLSTTEPIEDDHESDLDDDVPSREAEEADEQDSDDIDEKMSEDSTLRHRVKKSTASKI